MVPPLVDNPPPHLRAARQVPATCYRRQRYLARDGKNIMRITLVGSRHFGVTTFNMLRQRGVDIVRVVVADTEDRLATAARAAGIEVTVQADPKLVVAREIADATDLIVTAHSHARVSREALAAATMGG